MVITIPVDRTLAEWTPGCLYEVQAEKQSNGTLWTCSTFDPNECFIAGIEYAGYIRHDGNSWYARGTHYFPGFAGGIPCFGAISNTNAGKAVKVDFAELKAR